MGDPAATACARHWDDILGLRHSWFGTPGWAGVLVRTGKPAPLFLPADSLQAVKQGVRVTLAMGEQPSMATLDGQQVLQAQLVPATGED